MAAAHDGTVFTLSIGDGKRLDLDNDLIYNDVGNTMGREISLNHQNVHSGVKLLSELYGWKYEVR